MNWRLLLDGAAHGARNMAVDEALLLAADHDGATPVLRFYSWQPACLSLGRFQRCSELAASSRAVRDGVAGRDWVRRPTGGRAVWHCREVTYALVLREANLPPDARGVAGAYRYLSSALVAGLAQLGVGAEQAPADDAASRHRAQRQANCFANATRSDFVVDGRKLIGSAQCRRNGAVLQHGSLLLAIEAQSWNAALGDEAAGADSGPGSGAAMVSLAELGVQAEPEAVIAALCRGVEASLGARLHECGLTEGEQALAATLQQKYAGSHWNLHGREPGAGA
jgi:lipoate-protein ligase A